MNLILHQFKTDFRRFRGWLAALWLMFFVECLILPGIDSSEAQQIIATLLPFSQILFCALLMASLVQADALVDTTAFWMTRPIRRATVFWSKTAFVALCLLIPILVAQNLGWHFGLGFSFDQHLSGTWELAVIFGGILFLAAAIAALSKNVGQFFVQVAVLLGLFAGWMVLCIHLNHQSTLFSTPHWYNYDGRNCAVESRVVVAVLLGLASVAAAWAVQALTGRVKTVWFLLVLPIFSAIPIMLFGPIIFQKTVPFSREARVSLLTTNDTLTLQQGSQLLWSHFRVDGLKANQFVIVHRMWARFCSSENPSKPLYTVNYSDGSQAIPKSFQKASFDKIQGFFPDTTFWFTPPNMVRESSWLPVDLVKGRSPVENFKAPQTGSFSGDLEMNIVELKQSADLPLSPCQTILSPGRRLVIKSVVHSPRGIEINLSRTEVSFSFEPDLSYSEASLAYSCTYVLYHPAMGEAFVQDADRSRPTPIFLGRNPSNFQIVFPYSTLQSRLTGVSPQEWLKGARLRVFETVPIEQLSYRFNQTNYLFEPDRAKK